ncbi:MAG: hypothetical protein ACQEP8_00145 [Chlamydiota bacterium]
MLIIIALSLLSGIMGMLLVWGIEKFVIFHIGLEKRNSGSSDNLLAKFQERLRRYFQDQLSMEEAPLRKELDTIAEDTLEGYFVKVKEEIPMARMVLKGDLADSLKGLAKQELYKVLPRIACKLFDKALLRLMDKRLPRWGYLLGFAVGFLWGLTLALFTLIMT